jgi:hypothetical protein
VLGLKLIEGDSVYCGFVEGALLDKSVNQERTYLAWPGDTFEKVHRAAIDLTKDFLSEQIQEIRRSQAAVIERIRSEHPRFLTIANDPEKLAGSLHLSTQGPEDIFLEISRVALRQYNQKKKSFNEAKKLKLPDFDQ